MARTPFRITDMRVIGALAPQTGDVTAPTIPQNVVATAVNAGRVDISWTASTDDFGVSGYQIFRNGSPLNTTALTSYTDSTCQPSTFYSYVIVAFDASGHNSAASNPGTATTPANAAPVWQSIPAQTLITGNSYLLQLTDYCTDADLDTLTFSIPVGTLPTGVTLSGTRLQGTPTVAGQTPTITVRAADAFHTIDTTIAFHVYTQDVTAPPVPTGLAATAISTSQINVSWNASVDAAGGADELVSGTQDYRIYRATDAVNFSLRTTQSATTYSDTGLSASTRYDYKVTARDVRLNESSQSSAANATTQSVTTSGAPFIIAIDAPSGPVNADWKKAAYLTIYMLNPGNFSDYGITNFVTIGGVNVGDYRCLELCKGKVGTFWNFYRLTVNVGALSGLTLGTAYPIAVTVGGVGPSNATSGSNYVTLDNDALTFTPNPGRMIYVDPVNGVNPSRGTVPTGANLAAGDGGYDFPVKDAQTYPDSSGAFGGAFTCPNSATSSPTATTNLPPGSHVVLRGGTYTNYLKASSFPNPWVCFWQITGNTPTGAANTGYVVMTGYPGAAGANASESPQFIGPVSSAATANGGGIFGADGARSVLANSFNSGGYSKNIVISNLKILPNTSSLAEDGGPINFQNVSNNWRVFNNECTWPCDIGDGHRRTGGIQVVGDSPRVMLNYIHDIFGTADQENHGIYNGEGGSGGTSIAVTNAVEAFNFIENITNASGVSVANGGSGIQFHNGSQNKPYTNCRVHHNVIDTTIKYGIDCVGGSRTIDIWCNLIVDVQQIPIYFGENAITLIRIENNTIVGCNNGNKFGYGGTGYAMITNNGGATPSNVIRLKNNVLYQRSDAPTWGGYVNDGSGSSISLDTNYFYDASGLRTSAAGTNGVYTNPLFADLANKDFHPGASSPLPNKAVASAIGFVQKDLLLLTMPQGSNTKVVVGALERAGG